MGSADKWAVTQRIALERNGLAIRLLIADQNVLFRRGLKVLLTQEQGFAVLQDASTAAETLSRVRAENPDVLLISLDLLAENGGQVGHGLRSTNPDLAILVFTSTDSPENLQKSIEAGARGYMLKSSSPAQIIKGIRQIACPGEQDPSGVSATIPDLQALAARTPPTSRPGLLTSREQEVVRLLAEGRTVREVAKELSLSIKTIEAHKLNLMRKLNIHNRMSLVEYATREGMVNA